jgi:hypothetical protein
MKKRKREKLNAKKEARKKEYKITQMYNDMELVESHFDLLDILILQEKDVFKYPDDLELLSCSKCTDFEQICKGKGLKGMDVLMCLRDPKHEGCKYGIAEFDEYDNLSEKEL